MSVVSSPSPSEPIAYASSAAFELYQRAPRGETDQAHKDILSESVSRAAQICPIATLFPSETIMRCDAPIFVGGSADWRKTNVSEYNKLVDDTAILPCVLSVLRNVTAKNAALYFNGGERFTMLYETHRPNDRPTTMADFEIKLREKVVFSRKDLGKSYIFIASAGSHNWGHWLTDDLPRIIAASFLRNHMPLSDVTLLLLSFGVEIDAARRRSIECHPDLHDVSIQFLQRSIAYQFDELFFASPVSFHPILKSRSAVQYVRRSYVREPDSGERKIYITRPKGDVRSLVNHEEIEDFMLHSGFEVVNCACIDFDQQVKKFSEASLVVGLMGAAMTNTIFSRPGARIVHLACSGWMEPFYWDLAGVCGQRCSYVFGPSVEPHNPPHYSRFSIAASDLAEAIHLVAA